MKLRLWSKTIVLGVSAIALAACSTTGGKHAQYGQAGQSGADQAQSYAMQSQRGFRTDRSGRRINSLKAPANQSYYFAFDSSSMRPKDLNAMQVQAKYLIAHPNAKIRLEGNTDERGSREYNVGLGWRRDQAVARLLEQQGVKPSQIQMVSYGKERPIAMEHSERAWAENRRVDLVYK